MTRQTTLDLRPDRVEKDDSADAQKEDSGNQQSSGPSRSSQNSRKLAARRRRPWKPEFDSSPHVARILDEDDDDDDDDDDPADEHDYRSEQQPVLGEDNWKPQYDDNISIAKQIDIQEGSAEIGDKLTSEEQTGDNRSQGVQEQTKRKKHVRIRFAEDTDDETPEEEEPETKTTHQEVDKKIDPLVKSSDNEPSNGGNKSEQTLDEKVAESVPEKTEKKKHIRVRFAEDTDDETPEEDEEVAPEWKSIYDKSEMMVDSDYQHEISDSELSSTSDCTERIIAMSEKIESMNGKEPEVSAQVKAPSDDPPVKSRSVERSLSNTSDCTEQALKVVEKNKKKKDAVRASSSTSASSCSDPEEIKRIIQAKRALESDSSSSSSSCYIPRNVLKKGGIDEDEDSEEEGKLKAAEWLAKSHGVPDDLPPSPELFDDSSTDCSDNANLVIDAHERNEKFSSNNSAVTAPDCDKFDESSDTEEDDLNIVPPQIEIASGQSDNFVNLPTDNVSKIPVAGQDMKSDARQHLQLGIPRQDSLGLSSTLNTGTLSGRFDMTEDALRKLDSPSTDDHWILAKIRSPEKSPHELLMDKTKEKIDHELHRSNTVEEEISKETVIREETTLPVEAQESPRENSEMKAKMAHEEAEKVMNQIMQLTAKAASALESAQGSSTQRSHSDDEWKKDITDTETESETDYSEDGAWETDEEMVDSGRNKKPRDENDDNDVAHETTEKDEEVNLNDDIASSSNNHDLVQDPFVIQHTPEPDLMGRLNKLLGKTMDEIKSADSQIERVNEMMARVEETGKASQDKKTDVMNGQGFFDTALRADESGSGTSAVTGDVSEGDPSAKNEKTAEIDNEESDTEVFDNTEENEAGYISDTDEPNDQFTPGRTDYSFSESDNDLTPKRSKQMRDSGEAPIREDDELIEMKRREKGREEVLNQMGRMRFKQIDTTITNVETEKSSEQILKEDYEDMVEAGFLIRKDKETDEQEDNNRKIEYSSSSSSSSYSSTSSSSSDKEKSISDAGNKRDEVETFKAPEYRNRKSSTSSTSSSSLSSSAWSEDEQEVKKVTITPITRKLVTDDSDLFNDTQVWRTRQWADEQSDMKRSEEEIVPIQAEESTLTQAEYKNMGASSDDCTQPLKPTPPRQERPSSATQAKRQIRSRRVRPLSAQSDNRILEQKQYNLDLNYAFERKRPTGTRVSSSLYKYEPKDNDTRLKQKYTELLEIVEGDPMPIVVGPPTKTGKFSPRLVKSPRERSRSSESEADRRRPSPRTKTQQKEVEEVVDIEAINKELDHKYQELEALLCKVGGDDAVKHRLVERQRHQAVLLAMKSKGTGDSKQKEMEGYQYGLLPRPYTNGGVPNREDPRTRSLTPTDHQLRNSDNPAIKDWLKHKEKCLRIQRAEERLRRREEKKKEKQDISEKEEKYKESIQKVDDWMKKKRKEGRRLLKYRNNKENFINLNRPQSARPEVILTTTSLEFKRPSSATVQRSSSDLPQRRPKSAKPKITRREDFEEPPVNDAANKEKDKRRISYDQWLQAKRKEDEARKLDERMRLEDLRKNCQDAELEKIIPDLARNRIRIIESNKKRVDSGIKHTDDEANSYPRPKTSTGTKGLKMYRWRPNSAQPSASREEQSGNKYQLIRPNNTSEYGPSPYRLSTEGQSMTIGNSANASSANVANASGSGRPGSARNRTRYAEHIWTNFSDNVWKQVNEENKDDKRPLERPEPMGQAENASSVEQKSGKSEPGNSNLESEPKPSHNLNNTSAVKMNVVDQRTDSQTDSKIKFSVEETIPTRGKVSDKKVDQQNSSTQKSKTFLETITNESEAKTDSHKTEHKPKESVPVAVEKPKETEVKQNDVKVSVTKPTANAEAKVTVTIINEKAQIEPNSVVVTSPIRQRSPSPEPTSVPASQSPPEVVVLSQDGDFKGANNSSERRSSILKTPTSGILNAHSDAPRKKKTVTFGDVQMSDGSERNTSSDSDIERVPVSAYRGHHNGTVSSGMDNFFLTDLNSDN